MNGQQIGSLARILSKDSGLTVTISGTDSWYDSSKKHLNISAQVAVAYEKAAPAERQEIKNALCGLVYHEALHATDTDREKPPGLKGTVMNILEDGRNEQLGMERRPGSRSDFLSVCRFYTTKPAAKPADLTDAIVLYMLGKVRADFLKQEPMAPYIPLAEPFLVKMLGTVKVTKMAKSLSVNTLQSLSNTTDVLVLTEKIIKIIGEPPKPEPPEQQDQQNPGEGDEGEGTGSDENNSPGEQTQDQLEEPDEGAGGQGQESNETPDDSQSGKKPAKGKGKGDSDGNAPGQATKEQIAEALAIGSNLGDLAAKVLESLDEQSPQPTREERLDVIYESPRPLRQSGRSFPTKTAPVSRATLQRLLLSSDKVEFSNHLQGRKLGKNLVNIFTDLNPKPFQRRTESPAVRTAVSVWVDHSGSMDNDSKIECAEAATLALCKTLETLPGIAVEAGCFSDGIQYLKNFEKRVNPNNFPFPEFGNTRTHAAMIAGRMSLLSRPEERKVMIIMTDGAADLPDIVRRQNDLCKAAGIEVLAIGITDTNVLAYWPDSPVITDPKQLEKALFGMAAKNLRVKR